MNIGDKVMVKNPDFRTRPGYGVVCEIDLELNQVTVDFGSTEIYRRAEFPASWVFDVRTRESANVLAEHVIRRDRELTPRTPTNFVVVGFGSDGITLQENSKRSGDKLGYYVAGWDKMNMTMLEYSGMKT